MNCTIIPRELMFDPSVPGCFRPLTKLEKQKLLAVAFAGIQRCSVIGAQHQKQGCQHLEEINLQLGFRAP